MKHLASLLIAGALMPLVGGCAHISAEPVTARVVDDVGQPVAGVVVVAYWELHKGSFTGDALPCGAADVEEAVTDQEGRFQIPSWGPVWSSCDMRSYNPLLVLFKSGYYPEGMNNNPVNPLETVSVSRSIWSGKTIVLRRYFGMDLTKTTPPSYRDEFEGLNGHLLDFVVNYPGECNWKKIPNMLHALMAQEQLFFNAGHRVESIVSRLTDSDESLQKAAPQCRSPKAFIEGLAK